MAQDRKRYASNKEVLTAPPVAVSSELTTSQPREQFLALIRALAREAARTDFETGLGKTPDPRHSSK